MTTKQLNWAQSHDWYYYAGTCTVTGNIIVHVMDDTIKGATLSFDNFEDLYNWAGY